MTQHIEDLGVLWNTRCTAVRSANVALRHLSRLDERLRAHLDGCVVAGGAALRLAPQVLPDVTPLAVFSLATIALSVSDREAFERVIAMSEAVPESYAGLPAAMGWVSPALLSGIAIQMLHDQAPLRRRAALDSCRLHSVRPPHLEEFQADRDLRVRAAAIRLAGAIPADTLGYTQYQSFWEDADLCVFWTAWSRVLRGDQGRALEVLTSFACGSDAKRRRAFQLAIQAMHVAAAHRFLRELADAGEKISCLIEGAGIAGDPMVVPWLIGHMSEDSTARVAGEAFSLITGLDLALLDLERRPPENFESGPNDDPDDTNVDMDLDDGLPWPDMAKVDAWWTRNGSRFEPGVRYFMGQPITREHCIHVLKTGYQRQRILAANYLCLLDPGTPLFNTSAPAWRQQEQLAQMS